MIAISPTYKIKDPDFDVNLIAKYDLYLQLQLNGLHISVFDTEENKCILFESYDFSEVGNESSLLDCLKSIWEQNVLLTAGAWHKIICIQVNREFVFIPYEHYNEEAALNYLKLNTEFDQNSHTLRQIKHYELDTVCSFPVNNLLEDWLNEQYKQLAIQYAHVNNCFLQGLLTNGFEELCVSIHADLFSIAWVQDRKLKFINTFPYETPSDILYFILFVMDELQLNTEEASLTCWSSVDSLENITGLLRKYIRKVETGTQPNNLTFPASFDILPKSHSFDLFSAYYLLR